MMPPALAHNYGFMSSAGRWTCPTLMAVLFAVLAGHVVGVGQDFIAAIHSPVQLDYGEGIVWQQAALIPGPRMYGNSEDLPFIVFHYPPLYHLLARAALPLQPDLRAAGRLLSVLATIGIAFAGAGLVLVATWQRGRPLEGTALWSAAVTGMLLLCLHAVRSWGVVMRVDMMATVLGLLGLLVGAWANGRFWGTAAALLLCVAAMFTKQTELAPGVAVFLLALLRNPRATLLAAVLAGGAGLAALELLQWLTSGGFLHNIISYNINRFNFRHGYEVFRYELLDEHSFRFMVLMVLAAASTLLGLLKRPAENSSWGVIRTSLSELRSGPRSTTARAILLVHFAFASLMLVTVFKNGSSYNYLVDSLCVGAVLLGVFLYDLARTGAEPRQLLAVVTTLLILGVIGLPFRQGSSGPDSSEAHEQDALVHRIAAATKPVASENMSLLMQAGKPVLFEPGIVTELASQGKWDETPLLNMIRSGGFAFMITQENTEGGSTSRTATVDAAMRISYPLVEQVGSYLWVHMPQVVDRG
jgi:hypothetical protein